MPSEEQRPIEDEPAVRVAVPEDVFQGPAWLADKAAHPAAGPHTRGRVKPTKGAG